VPVIQHSSVLTSWQDHCKALSKLVLCFCIPFSFGCSHALKRNFCTGKAPFSGVGRVVGSGAIVVTSWNRTSAERRVELESRITQQSNTREATKRMIVFRVLMDQCPDGKKCLLPCDEDTVNYLFEAGPQSVSRFVLVASRGALKLTVAEVRDITVASFTDPAVVTSRNLPPGFDFYAYMYPPNFWTTGALLAKSAAGQADLGGVTSWFRSCSLTVMVHEWMHNLGMGHAWAYNLNGDKWINTEYRDFSEVMSTGGGSSSPWLGIASPHLASLRWLLPEEILSVTIDGEYTIPNSLSSNVHAIRAASVFDSVWLDWREPLNQDVDLGHRDIAYPLNMTRNGNAKPFESLFVHVREKTESTLQAMLLPGQSVMVMDFTITALPKLGTFRVSGLPRLRRSAGVLWIRAQLQSTRGA
jgi:hypothetical protein